MMPGIYIVIFSGLAMLIAFECGRRLLICANLQRWLTGTWFWFSLAWVMAGVTSYVCEDGVVVVFCTVMSAFTQLLAMGIASWLITRFRFRYRPALRNWVLAAISLMTGFYMLWNKSRFFGIPYQVMSLAFQNKAPLVFTALEFKSEAWTDYRATMKVEFPPGVLQQVLTSMGTPHIENDEQVFSWVKEVGTQNAYGASVRVGKDMNRAEITYWAE